MPFERAGDVVFDHRLGEQEKHRGHRGHPQDRGAEPRLAGNGVPLEPVKKKDAFDGRGAEERQRPQRPVRCRLDEPRHCLQHQPDGGCSGQEMNAKARRLRGMRPFPAGHRVQNRPRPESEHGEHQQHRCRHCG